MLFDSDSAKVEVKFGVLLAVRGEVYRLGFGLVRVVLLWSLC